MKAYEDPTIVTLGTIVELTQAKCGGSGDSLEPQLLEGPLPVDPGTCES